MNIVASELQVGDIVHYNKQVSWKIETLEPTKSGKGLQMTGTYAKCEFAPGQLGQKVFWTFRVATKLNVTREEA